MSRSKWNIILLHERQQHLPLVWGQHVQVLRGRVAREFSDGVEMTR